MEQNYTGIVLNKKDIGEADRLYFIYTLERGQIKVVGRGVRKSQAKLSANLENFNLIKFSVAKNRGMGNITNVTVENYSSKLKENLESLKVVFQASQLFNSWVIDEKEEKEIFILWQNFLNILNLKKLSPLKIKLIYLGFIFQLLNLLGYRLEVNYCVSCRRRINKSANYFSAKKGGILCKKCGYQNNNKILISDDSIKILRLFFSNQLAYLLKIKVYKEALEELEKILNYFIKWI